MSSERGVVADGRVAWVDYSKGICIILVVMMHSTLGLGIAMGHEGFMHYVVAFARPFRMPDFFMISGLFLSRVIDRPWREYSDKKVLHFAYFYLLWLAIQTVVKSGVFEHAGATGVASELAFGLIEPFGTLWFIYLLPVFFVTTKLLRRVPWPLLLAAGALLETARINTGWTAIDEFASRYVYFLAGYMFAPRVFAFTAYMGRRPMVGLGALAAWAAVEIFMVSVPGTAEFGFAGMPGLSLVMGFAGALAIVTIASLLSRAGGLLWLRYCGKNSIVIYLAFFLPMAAMRRLIVKTGFITDVGWGALLVTVVGVAVPIALHLAVKDTRLRFLFERPAALHLGRRPSRVALQPAE